MHCIHTLMDSGKLKKPSVIQRKTQQRGKAQVKPVGRYTLLMMLGLIVLFAALPPVGLVVYLCIVFSDGTPSGFVGCLTPFLTLSGNSFDHDAF